MSSTQDVVFGPGAAVRFVILDPVDGTAPGPILVTVQALDQFGNVASSENRDVTLLTTGSASFGGFSESELSHKQSPFVGGADARQ